MNKIYVKKESCTNYNENFHESEDQSLGDEDNNEVFWQWNKRQLNNKG